MAENNSAKLFALGDLHLSLGADKPMDIFGGWDGYVEKLKAGWNSAVGEDDLVVVPGDVSWAMTLENAVRDFEFINNELSGNKILLKGNHDYWWATHAKMNRFLEQNNFERIRILSNNAYLFANSFGSTAICGSRGWLNETGVPEDLKILNREASRLDLSFSDGVKQLEKRSADSDGRLLAFLHYPPVYRGAENALLLDVLKKYRVSDCYYGHIHGAGKHGLFCGEKYGIRFHCTSSDLVNFTPVRVL